MKKYLLILLTILFLTNCDDGGPGAGAGAETQSLPIPEDKPTSLVDPPGKTFADCPITVVEQTPCEKSLFEPTFCLDFDSPEELSSKNVVASGEIDLSLPGRNGLGHSAKPISGYLSMPAADVLNNLSTGTISFWISAENSEALTSYFQLLDIDHGSEDTFWSFTLNKTISANLQFYSRVLAAPSGDEIAHASIANWVPNRWYNLAITWDLTSAKIFIDGVQAGAVNDVSNFPRSGALPKNLYLLSSNRNPLDNPIPAFGGFRIDLFASYSKALSEDEIKVLYMSQLDNTGPTITANNRLIMKLYGKQDGYGIKSISDSSNGVQKVNDSIYKNIWEANFETLDGSKKFSMTNGSSNSANLSCKKASDSDEVVLRWENIPTSDTSYISVLADITPINNSNDIGIKINVDNVSNEFTLKSVKTKFDSLLPPQSNTETTELLLPSPNIGSSVRNPFVNELNDIPLEKKFLHLSSIGTILYPSRFMSMQWLGLIDDSKTGGIYIGAHDGTASLKTFTINRNNSNTELNIGVLSLADKYGTAGNDHLPEWYSVISLIDGSWYKFARHYRDFALGQRWTQKGPIYSRADNVPWMENAGLIQSSSSNTAEVVDDIARAAGETGLVLWHFNFWQKSTTYDDQKSQLNDTPMTELNPDLEKYLISAEAEQRPALMYFVATSWDAAFDTPNAIPPLTQDILTSAIRTKDGGLMSNVEDPLDPSASIIGNVTENYVNMCPKSPQWQAVVEEAAKKIVQIKAVKGIYYDMVATYNPFLCYGDETAHKHSSGSNHYYVDGYVEMIGNARAKAREIVPDAGTYSEGFSDPYMDVFDGFLTVFTARGNPLPLAMAAYHDYTEFIGRENNINLESAASIIGQQGEFFTWGGMPGFLSGQSDLTREALFRHYVVKLGIYRRHFKDYLVYGDMLEPPEILISNELATNSVNVTKVTVLVGTKPETLKVNLYDATELQKYNDAKIAAGKPDEVISGDDFTASFPRVIASAWQGYNGKKGYVVTSLDRTNHVVYLPLSSANVIRIDPNKDPTNIGPVTGGLKINLPADEVVLIEAD